MASRVVPMVLAAVVLLMVAVGGADAQKCTPSIYTTRAECYTILQNWEANKCGVYQRDKPPVFWAYTKTCENVCVTFARRQNRPVARVCGNAPRTVTSGGCMLASTKWFVVLLSSSRDREELTPTRDEAPRSCAPSRATRTPSAAGATRPTTS